MFNRLFVKLIGVANLKRKLTNLKLKTHRLFYNKSARKLYDKFQMQFPIYKMQILGIIWLKSRT